MDNKGYFNPVQNVFLYILGLVLIIVSCFSLYTSMKDLEVQVEELQRTVEQQDEEILELQAKNSLLKDEIASLEIFDCTFKKFPELRDQLLIDTFKGELPESNPLDEGSENDGAF